MALGFAPATANAILNCYLRATNITAPAEVWAKLHVGDPGGAGTSNAAVETTRKQLTFGDAPSGGACSNTAAPTWTAVAGTEDYTHVSLWTASTGGTFLKSGTITANAVTAGDNFTLPVGDIDVSIPVAA